MNRRRLLFQLLTAAALVALGGVMLIIGRGHMVYLDNKTLEVNGQSFPTPYKVVVRVGGEQIAKLYTRERGESSCIGQSFSMSLDITQEKGGEEVSRDITLSVPYNMDGVIINLPGLLAGLPQEAYLTEFVPAAPEEDEAETPGGEDIEGLGDEFGLGGEG